MNEYPQCPFCKTGELSTVPAEGAWLQHVICPECDSTFAEEASMGDTIECSLKSMPGKLQAVLDTKESLDYGNLLVASRRWKVVK